MPCFRRRYNERMPRSDDMKGRLSPVAAGHRGDLGVKLTYDDLLLFPDDGKQHEAIDGEHYVTPSPSIRHQRLVGRLLVAIAVWLEENPAGEVFAAPLDVRFSRLDVVEPDLLYVSRERAGVVLAGEHVLGAPDLVVEIASPKTKQRDETVKLRLYERAGVVEYWVVDPDAEAIRVYKRAAERFEPPVEHSRAAGDVLKTTLFPGLDISLSRVFRS